MKSAEDYRRLTEASLLPMLNGLGKIPGNLLEPMRYSLTAGGKRIRPVLLLAACEAAGGTVGDALPFACALEMIHTYSLIHDDLPAMDNDDLRRGKPTNHKVYGEGAAVLAGDGLLNAAMEIMAQKALGMTDQRGIQALEAIARHAGVTGMIAGQAADLAAEHELPDEETLNYIHRHKTSDLLTAPVEAGLRLAAAGERTVQAGIRYGYHLGMAFQITDDLLDVTGSSIMLGKNTGMDAAMGKMTWVTLKGIEGARKDAEEHTSAAEAAAAEMELLDDGFFAGLARETLNRIK